MPARVALEVTAGPIKGKVFTFDTHDAFLFGRSRDCHARLPENDKTVSRHHFIMEVNPPCATIRDLGSLNGTLVNDKKHGGREPHETPEEASKKLFQEVDLSHGDLVQVGSTEFRVSVFLPIVCSRCGKEIRGGAKRSARSRNRVQICTACRQEDAGGSRASRRGMCSHCGHEITPEPGGPGLGPRMCGPCLEISRENPMAGMMALLREKGKAHGLSENESFPGYRVKGLLGRGAMGAVYLAVREQDDQKVAIKVMLAKVAVDAGLQTLFLREMQITMRLRHPNIVELYDQGAAGGGFYFVMEYCSGGSLEFLMNERGGFLSVDEAKPLMLQALEGLAYAHKQGFVHRDLKPRNILLTAAESRAAKISDLGSSKNFQEAGFSGMTLTGAMSGTPMYMPREQLLNFKYVKPVSDVWGMAATFYRTLTGEYPRDLEPGESPVAAVLKRTAVPIRERHGAIPPKVAKVIDRALSDNLAERYQDAREFLMAMRRAF